MRTGTILFNGVDLTLYGRPTFTHQRSAQPAAPARATHWQTALSVSIEIDTVMPATARARIEKLQETLDITEGQLIFQDENGHTMSWLAQPGSSNIGEILKQGFGVMQLQFSAREELNSAVDTTDAKFRAYDANPDGSEDIDLHRIHSWNEAVKTARSDERAGKRKLTTTNITLEARSTWADTSLDYNTRLAWLHTKRDEIKGMDTKEGLLTRGAFSETVQVESINIGIGGNAEFLTIGIQCRFAKLPGTNSAEVEYTVSDNTDWATGKLTRGIQGTIEAPDQATAEAKADAVITAYQTAGYRLRKKDVKQRYLDGEDQLLTVPEFIQYDFTAELSQYIYTMWKLSVNGDETAQGSKATYSGTVTSPSLAAALAKATELSNRLTNPHTILLTSKMTLKSSSDAIEFGDGSSTLDPALNTQEFTEINFSSTYAIAASGIKASINQEFTTPSFGDYTTRISGEITAPNEAAAQAAARAYIPVGTCLRENTESSTTLRKANDSLWTKMSFSYGWRNTHTATSLKYTETYAPDYRRMVGIRTLTGTARATDEATATAAVNTLLADPLPNDGKITAQSNSTPYERCGTVAAGTDFIQMDFTITIEEDLVGTIAHDVIEAKWSLARVGMVDHTPITAVPCGMPVKQTIAGSKTVGKLTASGSCTARVAATARTWGQTKRTLAINYGGAGVGAEDPPQEHIEVSYKAFSNTTPTTYTFNFTYSARYAVGLTGIWPASGLDLT